MSSLTHGILPFKQSLRLVLDGALRELRADGACLYEYRAPAAPKLRECIGCAEPPPAISGRELSPATRRWLSSLVQPVVITRATDSRFVEFLEVSAHRFTVLVAAPLRGTDRLVGILTVGWFSSKEDVQVERLEPFANALTAMLLGSRHAEQTAYLNNQIAQAALELADWKIAERLKGILADHAVHQAPVILRDHVERVIERGLSIRPLQEQLAEITAQLEERKVVAEAKALLQRSQRLTEEQAYKLLRSKSRRARKRLVEIAGALIKQQNA